MKRTEGRSIFQHIARSSTGKKRAALTSATVVATLHQDARSGDSYIDCISDLWSVLIVRDVLAGSYRLKDFRRTIGAPEEALSMRLAALVGRGILQRRGIAGSVDATYLPTERGLELWPILEALARWGRLHPSPPVNAEAAPQQTRSDRPEDGGL